jgi:hypothetical protein
VLNLNKSLDWLYKPANINDSELKLIQFELLVFLKKWCQERNVDIFSLESQFIAVEMNIDYFLKDSTLRKILTRMQIDDLLMVVCFIVVSENKYFPIHIDHYNADWMSFGLNIPVLNCKGSSTVWYDSVPDDNDDMPDYISSLTRHGRLATKCVQDHVKEIGSCNTNIPHWINVSVPHAPKCTHSKLRINCSLRFQPKIHEVLVDETFNQLIFKQ